MNSCCCSFLSLTTTHSRESGSPRVRVSLLCPKSKTIVLLLLTALAVVYPLFRVPLHWVPCGVSPIQSFHCTGFPVACPLFRVSTVVCPEAPLHSLCCSPEALLLCALKPCCAPGAPLHSRDSSEAPLCVCAHVFCSRVTVFEISWEITLLNKAVMVSPKS